MDSLTVNEGAGIVQSRGAISLSGDRALVGFGGGALVFSGLGTSPR